MRIFYIPDWVFTALEASGYGRKDVLDGKVLADTLSADDVAFLYVIQLRIDEVVPGSVFATFPSDRNLFVAGNLFEHLRDHDGVNRAINEYISNGTPEPFVCPPSKLKVELMDENTLVFSPTCKLSECVGMKDPSVVGKRDLLDCVIQKVYGMIAFSDLVVTPLMSDYISTCRAVAAGK